MKFKYELVVKYSGFSSEYDNLIEKTVGKEREGSGYGGGIRDMSFYFVKKNAVDFAYKKVNDLKEKVKGIKVSVKPYEDYSE